MSANGIVTNIKGGKQSASPYFLRGLPPLALLQVGRILKEGAEKYEADPFGDISDRNWHRITADEHLEHVLTHVVMHLSGDRSEDHPAHIATRALFFLHQHIVEQRPLDGSDLHADAPRLTGLREIGVDEGAS